MLPVYSWERDARNYPNFALPTSSDHRYDSRQHLILGPPHPTNLANRPSSAPSPNLSYTRDSLSLNNANREAPMSYNSNPKASGSSRPGSSSSSSPKSLRHRIALTIVVPKEKILRKTSKEGQSSPLRSKTSLDSKISDLLSLKERSSNSLSDEAPKFRVMGRGGSGSQLRNVSSSKLADSEPHVPRSPQKPLEPRFYRPTGRGGSGSSMRPLTPLKAPTAILDLLRGRKPSQAQLNEQCESQKVSPPPPIRPRSLLPPNLHYQIPNDALSKSSGSRTMLDEILFPLPLSAASPTSESILQNSDPSGDDDTDLYIEEPICPTPNEHRQRSLNKLAKTLGALPSTIIEGGQSGPVSKSPMTFNNSPLKGSRVSLKRASILTNLGDKFIGSRSSHHSWASTIFTDELHHWSQFDLADSEFDNCSSVESDIAHSPITFAPPSPVKTTPHSKETVTSPLSDGINPSLTTTRTTTPTGEHHNLAFSRSLTESLLPPPSPTTHNVSDHSKSHSMSLHNDLPPGPNNGLTEKSNWLVPLGMHNDEVVISIRRTAPSNPQSWTGEWNNDIQDVIESLRRL